MAYALHGSTIGRVSNCSIEFLLRLTGPFQP